MRRGAYVPRRDSAVKKKETFDLRFSLKKDNPPEALRPRGNYLYDKGENDELYQVNLLKNHFIWFTSIFYYIPTKK